MNDEIDSLYKEMKDKNTIINRLAYKLTKAKNIEEAIQLKNECERVSRDFLMLFDKIIDLQKRAAR